jgi:hypothetical protein
MTFLTVFRRLLQRDGTTRLPREYAAAAARQRNIDTFHRWALNLPFVVEHRHVRDGADVREFTVECDDLDIHHVWLVTHERHTDRHVLALVPSGAGPMSFLRLRLSDRDADRRHIEALLLNAYKTAFAGADR